MLQGSNRLGLIKYFPGINPVAGEEFLKLASINARSELHTNASTGLRNRF
jgi:hypothetical protein